MLVFCASCGREAKDDENFCPSCGKPLKSSVQYPTPASIRPTGITVLAILQIIVGIISIIAAIAIGVAWRFMGNMMYEKMMEQNTMPWMEPGLFGALGGALVVFLGVIGAVSIFIAWAMFSAKIWARKVVIIFCIIDLAFGGASVVTGNASGLGSIILNAIILYYMWRPHVIAYFNK